MNRIVPPEEAKKLPHWKEMNKHIKEMLLEHLGEVDYRIVAREDAWEIWVDDQLFGMINVLEADEPFPENKQTLN